MNDRIAAAATTTPALVAVGETFGRTLRYTEAEIAAFAAACGDRNPLHHDAGVAARSAFGRIIASGPHTTAMMMGLAATHFSRRDDGVARQMVGLNFNFAFKAPVFADEDVRTEWIVREVAPHERLRGLLVQIDGTAKTERGVALVGRGTVLVRAG